MHYGASWIRIYIWLSRHHVFGAYIICFPSMSAQCKLRVQWTHQYVWLTYGRGCSLLIPSESTICRYIALWLICSLILLNIVRYWRIKKTCWGDLTTGNSDNITSWTSWTIYVIAKSTASGRIILCMCGNIWKTESLPISIFAHILGVTHVS